jgi:hypothetical protein
MAISFLPNVRGHSRLTVARLLPGERSEQAGGVTRVAAWVQRLVRLIYFPSGLRFKSSLKRKSFWMEWTRRSRMSLGVSGGKKPATISDEKKAEIGRHVCDLIRFHAKIHKKWADFRARFICI